MFAILSSLLKWIVYFTSDTVISLFSEVLQNRFDLQELPEFLH